MIEVKRARRPIAGSFYRSTDQAYTVGSPAKLLINAALFNSGLSADLVTNNRITITRAGIYRVHGQVWFSTGVASGDVAQAFVYKNGTSLAGNGRLHAAAASDFTVTVDQIANLNATDYLELFASKTGSNSSFVSMASFFEVVYFGG